MNDLEGLLLVAAVQAARHATNTIRPPAKLPGRVISTGTRTASVLIDGDVDPISVVVPSSHAVGVRQRVMVEFRPGGAVSVAAVI